MPLQMVSNTGDNHLLNLQVLFKKESERLLIASPYLATNFKKLLSKFSFENIKKIELITTFKAKDPDQLSKPKILKDYFDFFKQNYPNINVLLHVDNKLHGKVYISSYKGNHSAIISSANFIKNGLINNHEWGLHIQNADVISDVIEDLINSIEYQEITYKQIERACMFAETTKENFPDWNAKPDINCDILDAVYSIDNVTNPDPQYFLKPIGHSGNPVRLQDRDDFSIPVIIENA